MTVLDQRRANNIQIEIKRLPAARHIRTAILNMDQSFFTKEMVEVCYNYNNTVLHMTYSVVYDI